MDFESFVLAASTDDLGEEPDARGVADAIEFRMDLAEDPLAQLDDYAGELPLIVTNRVEWEGGAAANGRERLDALVQAIEHPSVEAVDVELDAVLDGDAGRVIDAARTEGVATIVSAHDFEGMPERADVRRLLSRGADLGDVAKFAGVAETVRDALDLLDVTHERSTAGDAVATMAMGVLGRHTRAVAPVYGSRIGYAPIDPKRATAPGQYDLETLGELVEQLSPIADTDGRDVGEVGEVERTAGRGSED